MILLVAGSTDSITGPLPPHLPLKTPGIMTSLAVGKPSPLKISLTAVVVEFKSTGLMIIFDFNLGRSDVIEVK